MNTEMVLVLERIQLLLTTGKIVKAKEYIAEVIALENEKLEIIAKHFGGK